MKKKITIKDTDPQSDFEKTGISHMSFKIEFKITQRDMEKDLIKKTDGKFIKPEHFDENPN